MPAGRLGNPVSLSRERRGMDDTNKIVEKFNKKTGDNIAITLSSDSSLSTVFGYVSSGNIAIDRAIGKGIPAGRLTEIYGDSQSGKTLLAMQLIRDAQRRKGISIIFDTEHAFSKDLAKNVGINMDSLIYVAPESIENVFSYLENFVDIVKESYKDKLCIIIWDSVAATPCKFEIDNPLDKQEIGTRARLISKGLRKVTSVISKNKIALVFVNQIRQNIGVMYGSPYTTPGGKAIKFHASVSLYLKEKGKIEDSRKRTIGRHGSLEVTKNKVFPPFRKAEFDVLFGQGVPKYSGLAESLVSDGIIESSGGWMKFGEKKFRANDIEKFINDNPDFAKEIGEAK